MARQYPDDWKKAWQLLKAKWDKDDPCPEGVLKDFNIDARLNGGHIVLGLLWGKGDFNKTLDISTRAGQDSDCNPSSAAGVLGVMLGYDKIPDEWKSGIAAIADKKFQFTDYSFSTIVDSTLKRTFKVVESVGGKVTDSEIIVPFQQPKAPKLEQWNPGVPDKLVQIDDPAWQWKGNWSDETTQRLHGEKQNRRDRQGRQWRGRGSSTDVRRRCRVPRRPDVAGRRPRGYLS
jgi:hypothetical protein